jgi:hypothetical protein
VPFGLSQERCCLGWMAPYSHVLLGTMIEAKVWRRDHIREYQLEVSHVQVGDCWFYICAQRLIIIDTSDRIWSVIGSHLKQVDFFVRLIFIIISYNKIYINHLVKTFSINKLIPHMRYASKTLILSKLVLTIYYIYCLILLNNIRSY